MSTFSTSQKKTEEYALSRLRNSPLQLSNPEKKLIQKINNFGLEIIFPPKSLKEILNLPNLDFSGTCLQESLIYKEE